MREASLDSEPIGGEEASSRGAPWGRREEALCVFILKPLEAKQCRCVLDLLAVSEAGGGGTGVFNRPDAEAPELLPACCVVLNPVGVEPHPSSRLLLTGYSAGSALAVDGRDPIGWRGCTNRAVKLL